jgi:hypothetical protein
MFADMFLEKKLYGPCKKIKEYPVNNYVGASKFSSYTGHKKSCKLVCDYIISGCI